MSLNKYAPGSIAVEGAAFDDFLLTRHLPPDKAPAVIERDRLIMSARPGFNRKLLPLRIEQETGDIYSGGRYLFDTYENACAFGDWCRNDFAIDGVLILDRPDFADVSAEVYRVIGAYDYKDIHTSQIAYRTEIWKCNDVNIEDTLANLWPILRDRAGEDGKSSLWLLYQPDEPAVALVTVIDRSGSNSATELDYATINAIESSSSYGDDWHWAEKYFDRSHWVYTVWFENTQDANAKPPLWPNSPPLPSPETIQLKESVA